MGRIANRNDITIAIKEDGSVYVAQGAAERELIDDPWVSVIESLLYYSQLDHRVAVRTTDGGLMIATPNTVPSNARRTIRIGRVIGRMTGAPLYLGRV